MGAAEVLVSATWAFITLAAIFAGVMVQRFKTQERLRAIEKNVPIPAAPLHIPSPEERTANLRVSGILCVATALGLLVLFIGLSMTIPRFPKGVIGVAAIPFFIGLGFLLEYKMRRG
jgi:Domain of unknown function (DUF6249)